MIPCRLVVSPEAEKDILTLLEYTVEKWGEAQANTYLLSLDQGLDALSHNPYIGRARPDISPKHRSYPIERHVAIYFVNDHIIYLSRLFHHSRDVYRHEIPS